MKFLISVLLLLSGSVMANGYGRVDQKVDEIKPQGEEKILDDGIRTSPQERQEEKFKNTDFDPELDPINDDMTHDEGIHDD